VDLVEHTVKMIEPYAIERKVSVAVSSEGFDFENFRRRFSLDGRCVEQALLNLIDNALNSHRRSRGPGSKS